MISTVRAALALLTPPQRRGYLALVLLLFLAALLQVAGIASLAPFITLLSNTALIHQHPMLRALYDALPVSSDVGFMGLVGLGIMVLLAFTNLVAAYSIRAICSFTLRIGAQIAQDVYRGYLYRDYVYAGRSNTADQMATIVQQTGLLVYMILQPSLHLVSQGLIVMVVAVVLLYVNPLHALCALAIVGLGYGLVFHVLKRRLERHGATSWQSGFQRARLLHESLGGIKEIKLSGSERRYEERFRRVTEDSLRANTFLSLAGDLPRFALESVAFCAMLGLALYLLLTGVPSANIVGLLSLYAMAGYRVLPAAQVMFKSASTIKANAAVLDELRQPVAEGRAVVRPPERQAAADAAASFSGDLVLSDIEYTYPGRDKPALCDVTLRLPAHRITALVGESGAGKSTLLDVLLGLLHPQQGSFTVGAELVGRHNHGDWQDRIGYVPQNIFLTDDTLLANICFGHPQAPDRQRAMRAAALARLDGLVASLPGGLDYVVGENGALLSGGQRQRVAIARALYGEPSLIVMDEATSALDGLTEREIMNTVAELRSVATIVLVAHRASTIRYADHVVIVRDGCIADTGPYAEVLARDESLRHLMTAQDPEPAAVA